MSNVGIDGMNRWSLTNRGNLDGQWQLIDTWDTATNSLKTNITPHQNSFYGIGLMTRFTAKYSDVLKTEVTGGKDTIIFERLDLTKDTVQHVFAATFKKESNYSVFITNDSEKEFPLELSFAPDKNLTLYLYEINEKDNEGKMNCVIEPLADYKTNKPIIGVIKPESLMVYTTYHLSSGDEGIVK
jgi:hypothetical protein